MLFYSETFNVSQGITGALLQWDCSIEWTNEHILSEFAVDVVFVVVAAVDKSNIMKLDATRGAHHHQRLNFKMLLQFNSVFFLPPLSFSFPPNNNLFSLCYWNLILNCFFWKSFSKFYFFPFVFSMFCLFVCLFVWFCYNLNAHSEEMIASIKIPRLKYKFHPTNHS